jgi:hypothetical protein
VQPAEKAQVRVVECLHAERDPVDARVAIAAKALRLDRRRIGLERDLGIVVDAPIAIDRFEYRTDGCRFHQ